LAWKERFYEIYEDKFHSLSNSTLISKEIYLYNVESLKSTLKKEPKQKSWSEDEKNSKNTSYSQMLSIWDILHTTHQNLLHPRD
jgi:hypothetical protein